MDKFSLTKNLLSVAVLFGTSIAAASGVTNIPIWDITCHGCNNTAVIDSSIAEIKRNESSRAQHLETLLREVNTVGSKIRAEKLKCRGKSICENRLDKAAQSLSREIGIVGERLQREFVKAETLLSDLKELKSTNVNNYQHRELQKRAEGLYYVSVRLSEAALSNSPLEKYKAFLSNQSGAIKLDSLNEIYINSERGEIQIVSIGNEIKSRLCPEIDERDLFPIVLSLYSAEVNNKYLTNTLDRAEAVDFLNRSSGLKIKCDRVRDSKYSEIKLNLDKNQAMVFYMKKTDYRPSYVGIIGGFSKDVSYRYPFYEFSY